MNSQIRKNDCYGILPRDLLVEIIKIQTEIAKFGLDFSGVMAVAVNEVLAVTGADGAIIELIEGNEMVYRAASGMAASSLGLRLKQDASLSGRCVLTGKVQTCSDIEDDDRVDRKSCRKLGLRSLLVAPLFHEENIVGALKIISLQPGFFNDTHLCVLKVISSMVASAMYHSKHVCEKELHHRATHDVLTGIANRSLFYDNLRKCQALSSRHAKPFGVLILDMDNLKSINDRYGHRTGDAAIREVAQRIKRKLRQTDTVARLGGDEFGVILAELENRRSAEIIASRIAEEIRKPYVFEDKHLPLGASTGLAIYPTDGLMPEELIEKADQAMYLAKRSNKTHLFPQNALSAQVYPDAQSDAPQHAPIYGMDLPAPDAL